MLKNTLLFVALVATTLPSATAQDFGGRVTSDPGSGTVTYDFRFHGPQRGSATLFVSTLLVPQPFSLPPIGTLYLNPGSTFPMIQVPLDVTGRGKLLARLPMSITAGSDLDFQTLFIDRFHTLRVPDKWVTLIQDADTKDHPGPAGYALGYDSRGSGVDVQGWSAPGTRLHFRFFDKNRRLIGCQVLMAGANGKTSRVRIPLTGKFDRAASWQVWRQDRGSSQVVPWKGGTMR